MRELKALMLVLALSAAAVAFSPLMSFKDKADAKALLIDKASVTAAQVEYNSTYGSYPYQVSSMSTTTLREVGDINQALLKTLSQTSIDNEFKAVDLNKITSSGITLNLSKKREFVTINGHPDVVLTTDDINTNLSWLVQVMESPQIDLTKMQYFKGTVKDSSGNILSKTLTSVQVGDATVVGGTPDPTKPMTLAKVTIDKSGKTTKVENLDSLLTSPTEVQYVNYYKGSLSVVYKNSGGSIVFFKTDM